VSRQWICRRQLSGLQCGGINSPRARKCHTCGQPRTARRRPAHLRALDTGYEEYVLLNGGERCGICGTPPKTRRLDRDHDHHTGEPRGLLCHRCNRALPAWINPQWLRAAIAYLERERAA
jgi:hypothetical protein